MSVPTKEDIRRALEGVVDPEVGIGVYELGLVYEVLYGDQGDLRVVMTMTTPACPSSHWLVEQVREALARLPMVRGVEVELVWDPPWSPERMAPEARRKLGWGE